MAWWIALGVLLFALVLLGLVMAPVLARLGRLSRAAARAQARAAQAQTLQRSLDHLQERLTSLAAQVEAIGDRAAARSDKR